MNKLVLIDTTFAKKPPIFMRLIEHDYFGMQPLYETQYTEWLISASKCEISVNMNKKLGGSIWIKQLFEV